MTEICERCGKKMACIDWKEGAYDIYRCHFCGYMLGVVKIEVQNEMEDI